MRKWQRNKQITIESGKDIFLKDTNEKEYIDGNSSLWVNIHGHRKKEIDNAIKKQINKISHSTLLGLSNTTPMKLAEELVKLAPKGLTKVFYSDNGSTAVEIALKMAFQYWQLKGKKNKTKFIHLKNSYHGDTIGSVSVGGIDIFHKIFKPLLFKTYEAPSYCCSKCKCNKKCNWQCIKKLEEIMRKNHKEIAGFILEPLIQAAGGMLTARIGYLKKAKELCRRYNVLMIVDEVATGFGRTGKMFACEHENVSPDFLCLAKGITGGYLPLAVTLTTDKIFNAFLKTTFFHGHTYTGNSLACAAALANLKIFKKERTLKKLKSKIEFLKKKLNRFYDFPFVTDIRQCGFMAGIELISEELAYEICMKVRKYGLILRPLSNVIVIMPQLSIKTIELNKMFDILYMSCQKYMGRLFKTP